MTISVKLSSLRGERDRIAYSAREINDKYPVEKKLTDEDLGNLRSFLDQIEKIDSEINELKRLDQLSAADMTIEKKGDPVLKEDYINQIRNYLITGVAPKQEIKNTISTTTPSEGGYLVPEQYSNTIEVAMKAYGAMRSIATVARSSSGASINYPTMDPTAEIGEIVGQNVAVSNDDLQWGNVKIDFYKYSSKTIVVPWELISDSNYDLETTLRSALAERLGRITETHYISGTGTNQPSGLLTTAATGVTGKAGQVATVTGDDIISLQHSVDHAYRSAPGVGFLMHDKTLEVVRKLQDDNKAYMFIPGYQTGVPGGMPDRLLGYPIYISNYMPQMAAGAKSIVFGDFRKYKIHDVAQSMLFFRMTDSKYTEKGQVGFLAFMRTGGGLVDVGGALKMYVNPAR